MKLDIEASSNPGLISSVELTSDNLAEQHVLNIEPNVWGHVTLTAKGAGLALAQLNTQYNVDHDFLLLQPPVQAFDIDVDLSLSGRNKSRLSIRSCAKWLLNKQRNTSGVAVMELTIPTGYWQNKAVIDKYLESRVVPRLSQAKVMPRSATFIFDYVSNTLLFSHILIHVLIHILILINFSIKSSTVIGVVFNFLLTVGFLSLT